MLSSPTTVSSLDPLNWLYLFRFCPVAITSPAFNSVKLYPLHPNLDFPRDDTDTQALMEDFTKPKTNFYVGQCTQKLQDQIPVNPPQKCLTPVAEELTLQ